MISIERINTERDNLRKCCICNKVFEGFGNNPSPVVNEYGVECCDKCNLEVVFPARIKALESNRKDVLYGEDDRS